MHWLIQEKLFIENRRDDLLAALDRLSISYQMVRLTDQGVEADEPIDEDQPILTNGSVALSKIAQARGWQPGSLFNDNFSYEVWGEQFKDRLLNRDAVLCTIDTLQITADKLFVRPVLDTKSFNGRVMTREELAQLQEKSRAGGPGALPLDTRILVAPPKPIGQEHRHYIVEGEVITSSRYKLAGVPNFAEGADPAVVAFARAAAQHWQPARAFVLDTYISGDDIGVVELGGIGHAGLYQADLIQLVHALDSMPLDHAPEPAVRRLRY